MKGFIHSYETMGTLDGPGLRTVVFLQGCPLRCSFCHNVDSTLPGRGEEQSVESIVQRVFKNRPYWGIPGIRKDSAVSGGVTITGGDPVFQPGFLLRLVKRLKEEQVHVAVETSLYTNTEVIDSLLPYVDLWIVSIKHMDNKIHQKLTVRSNERILQNVKYLSEQLGAQNHAPHIRIRFVVIPGITNDQKHVEQLGAFVSTLKNLEVLELLPYVTIGRHKWIELFGKYTLEHVPEAAEQEVQLVAECLKQFPIAVKY